MPSHVALVGDSILDNAAYTEGGPDVAAHLRLALGAPWDVTLVALDGTTTTDIGRQFDRLRKPVSHFVLSVGGNDALLNASLLDAPVRSTGETLELFGAALAEFDANYRNVLSGLATRCKPLIACTIYNGNLSLSEANRARVALMMFNDVIIRAALDFRADVLELRAVCTQARDFANPIEPSREGGRKIAHAIAAALGAGESATSTIHAGPGAG